MLKMSHCIVFCAALSCAVGCSQTRDWSGEEPDAVVEQFLKHWYLSEDAAAFAMLLPEEREGFRAPREALKTRGITDVPEPHEFLLVRSVVNPYQVKKYEVVDAPEGAPSSGDRATVRLVRRDETTSQVHLRHGEDRWYVTLRGAAASEQ